MRDATEHFSPYDSADYLTEYADAAVYLETALEHGGDPALVAQVLGTIARSIGMSGS